MEKESFQPVSVSTGANADSGEMEDFILQPLYTKEEIRSFRKEYEKNGVFSVTKDVIHSVEDLEKLFFIWQEATERQDDAQRIAIGDEIRGEGGLTFSGRQGRTRDIRPVRNTGHLLRIMYPYLDVN